MGQLPSGKCLIQIIYLYTTRNKTFIQVDRFILKGFVFEDIGDEEIAR